MRKIPAALGQPDIEERNKEELFRISKYDTSEGSAL